MLFEAPLTDAEKCGGKCLTREATDAFFAPQEGAAVNNLAAASVATTTKSLPNPMPSTRINNTITPDDMHTDVTKIVNDPLFVQSHKSTAAPLAMAAFAKVVADRITNDRQIEIQLHFDGLTITVPSNNCHMEPHCHSVSSLQWHLEE